MHNNQLCKWTMTYIYPATKQKDKTQTYALIVIGRAKRCGNTTTWKERFYQNRFLNDFVVYRVQFKTSLTDGTSKYHPKYQSMLHSLWKRAFTFSRCEKVQNSQNKLFLRRKTTSRGGRPFPTSPPLRSYSFQIQSREFETNLVEKI